MLDITPSPAFRALCPQMSADEISAWVAALKTPLETYQISTIKRMAAFVGQCVVESGCMTELIEDLRYSSAGMRRVWPSRFPTVASTLPYVMQPEKLANHVYGGRMGNGPEESGDGWLFRGRGLIQTTGRDSYADLAGSLKRDVADLAQWMSTVEGAAVAACWDWNDMGCNDLADGWQITKLSERINGGDTAMAARQTACATALRALTS